MTARLGMPLAEDVMWTRAQALEGQSETSEVRKVPTGIADLDNIVDGGFPAGSTVLLWGEIGAGMQEYVYTAASKTALVHDRPQSRRFLLGEACDDSILPERICYVTFARSREGILRELAASFNADFYRAFREATTFKDFSGTYFRDSAVPTSWTHQDNPFESPAEDILASLVDFLDENGRDALVVIDSLTDLIAADKVEIRDLVTTMKGLQRASKDWGGVVYPMLTRGILEPRHEQALIDSVDGCLVFEWKNYLRSSKRQRYMYVEKFTSVLPHLPRDRIARFPTMVTTAHGLVVVYMERIA